MATVGAPALGTTLAMTAKRAGCVCTGWPRRKFFFFRGGLRSGSGQRQHQQHQRRRIISIIITSEGGRLWLALAGRAFSRRRGGGALNMAAAHGLDCHAVLGLARC